MSDLKRIRVSLGMSRERLARKVGVTASAIANYENGHRDPKDELIPKLAKELQLKAIDLVNIFNPPGPLSRFFVEPGKSAA